VAHRPSWDDVYLGSPPWDIGRPQPSIVALAEAHKLAGRVLDVGCGTGEHALLAARHDCDAYGVDISSRAIEIAQGKAAERGLTAHFQVGDALHLDRLGREFDVIIDSGVFHVFDDDERPRYVQSLASVLRTGGTTFLMCFSDRQPGTWGPRRVSQAELREAFSDGFSIESIEPSVFAVALDPAEVQAWLATIRRRAD
jgi:cyclopropane fatty-acyl-phospholipid synthase-like methyltransferase